MAIIITNEMKSVIKTMYSYQKGRKNITPDYTLGDLIKWITSQDKFIDLYYDWEESGRPKDLKPSVDRIDSSEGYSLDNIQLVTWEENRNNWYEEKRWNSIVSGRPLRRGSVRRKKSQPCGRLSEGYDPSR